MGNRRHRTSADKTVHFRTKIRRDQIHEGQPTLIWEQIPFRKWIFCILMNQKTFAVLMTFQRKEPSFLFQRRLFPMLLMFFIASLCLKSLRKSISSFNWPHSTLKTTWSLFIWNVADLQARTKSVPIGFPVLLKTHSLWLKATIKSLRQMFCNYISIKPTESSSFPSRVQEERSVWCQMAGRLLMRMNWTPLLQKSNRVPTIMSCFSILSHRKISSRRFLNWALENFCRLAASDANRGSSGGREGHLRAAVVVQFTRACAAYHSRVGVRASVRVSVPETPDVALWADRWNRLEYRILNKGSQRDQYNVITINRTALSNNAVTLPVLHTAPKIRTTKKGNYFFHFSAPIRSYIFWLVAGQHQLHIPV